MTAYYHPMFSSISILLRDFVSGSVARIVRSGEVPSFVKLADQGLPALNRVERPWLTLKIQGDDMKGFVQNIEDIAVKNEAFRQVLYTAKNC